ncbi:MAG: HAD-IA family hydrolase [Desulfopila sp.]
MKIYDTYLFDADGTLFDTVDLICTCFDHITRKYRGITVERATVIAGIGAPLRSQLLEHLGPDIDQEQVLADYLEYQLSIMADKVTPFPHLAETLAALKAAGKKLAVVTSRRRYSLEKILESTGTARYFDVLITPEDTTRHKPDAEPAVKAMRLLHAEPASTVFTGDAHYDICSGASAGTDTVFVNWSHIERSSLPVQPTWTIDSLPELTAGLNRLQ